MGDRSATIIGVPSPPSLPQETETSPTSSPARIIVPYHGHRPPPPDDRASLAFAPGVTLEQSRSNAHVYGAMTKENPGDIRPKRTTRSWTAASRPDHIGRRNRGCAASKHQRCLIMTCSNVANMILTRNGRRARRAGASARRSAQHRSARRMLAGQSLLLVELGPGRFVSAQPLVASWLATPHASRSVRSNLTVSSLLWVERRCSRRRGDFGVCPPLAGGRRGEWPKPGERQPPDHRQHEAAPKNLRGGTNRCILRAADGASTVITTPDRDMKMRRRASIHATVLTVNVSRMSYGKSPQPVVDFYRKASRIRRDAGVSKTASGWCSLARWCFRPPILRRRSRSCRWRRGSSRAVARHFSRILAVAGVPIQPA